MTSDIPAPAQEAHVEALRTEFVANGLDSLHGWRCEYPDRYGPCLCVDEFVRDFLASDWLAAFVADRQAEALREAADAGYGRRSLPKNKADYNLGRTRYGARHHRFGCHA